MKKWVLKAIVQKTISYLPYSTKVNYLFQKYVTKGVHLNDEYFYDRLNHASNHINSYFELSSSKKLTTSLELGTGWYPVVPISMFLCGVDKIYTVDVSFLTNKAHIESTIQNFLKSYKENKLQGFLPIQAERWEILCKLFENIKDLSLEEITNQLKLTYLVQDARNLKLEKESVDLIHSNNTFEHIYPSILMAILKEFKRIVKNGGIMSHAIDMSDHFAHFDHSISIYNYLQFSPAQWKCIDNSVQPQNRLRFTDYKKMYTDLNIPISKEEFRKGNLEELKNIKLDNTFNKESLQDIAISHCHFYSIM